MLSDKTVIDVNNSYGARLIEQGRAILAPVPAKKAETKKKASASQAADAADVRAGDA